MNKDLQSKIVGVILLILVGGFMFWVFSDSSEEYMDESRKKDIEEKYANDIIMFPEYDASQNAKAFILQMRDKEAHHVGYDVYTSDDKLRVKKILDIYISKGAYNFYSVNNYGDDLQIKIGNGKDLFECLENCFSQIYKPTRDKCFCSSPFILND
tara:strand:+ start:98 stop:562 length:465 start_codon:yes stop_codon:yes gene_type:complete